MSKIERRTVPVEVKANKDAEGRIHITGYAIPFNSSSVDLGGFKEVIMPGTFDGVLGSKRDIVSTVNHQPTRILGRLANRTLTLTPDAKGIFMDAIPPDTQAVRDAITEIEGGYMNGMSFQFVVKRDKFVRQTDGSVLREVREADLIELGPVTFPAYGATTAQVSAEARSAVEALQQENETEETPEAEASAQEEEKKTTASVLLGLLGKELDLLELE